MHNKPERQFTYIPQLPYHQLNQPPHQSDHPPIYSMHTQALLNRHEQPLSITSSINRSAYLDAASQNSRNSSLKQSNNRYSQQPQPISTKNVNKSSSISNAKLSTLTQSTHKRANIISQFKPDIPSYSQTLELASLSKTTNDILKNNHKTTHKNIQDESLKQKYEYLMILDKSFMAFEERKDIQILKDFSEKNRQFMVRNFEQNQRQKESKTSQKTLACDTVSESDNMSEDGLTVNSEERERNNSQYKGNDKQKVQSVLAKSKEKSLNDKPNLPNDKLSLEIKFNEQLQKQYQQEIELSQNSGEANRMRQDLMLQSMAQTIQNLDGEIAKLQQKNNQVTNQLANLPFFNEWLLMCKQLQGAKKYKLKLSQQLQKKREILKDVQENPIEEPKPQPNALAEVEHNLKSSDSQELKLKRQSNNNSRSKLPISNQIKLQNVCLPRPNNHQVGKGSQDTWKMTGAHQSRTSSLNKFIIN